MFRVPKDYIETIDGTHIHVCVLDADKVAYIECSGLPTHNILVVRDFKMCFTFIMTGWKGSVHDNHLLKFVMRNPDYKFPMPPPSW